MILTLADLPSPMRPFLSTRSFAADQFVADPELFWRLSPTWDEGNEVGTRGPWFAGPKPQQEYRILAVGDSCTYGFGVSWDQSYPIQLERILQARKPGQVVHSSLGAVPGYSTFQNLQFLMRHGAAVRPDLLTIYVGAWNDHSPAVRWDDARQAKELGNWRILRLLRDLVLPDLEGYGTAFQRGDAPDGRRVELRDFRANLVAIIGWGRSMGAEVVLVAPTQPAVTIDRYPGLLAYRDCVIGIAAELAVPSVDLGTVCAAVADPDTPAPPGHLTSAFLDWVHPSAATHAALAEALAAVVGCSDAGSALLSPGPEPVASCDARRMDVAMPRPAMLDPASVVRIWTGGRWTSDIHFHGGAMRFSLPVDTAAGLHLIRVADAGGVHEVGTVRVVQDTPTMALELGSAEGCSVSVEGMGPPGALVWLWWSAAVLTKPIRTQYGPFHMPLSSGVRELPGFCRFDLITENRLETVVNAEGRWSIRSKVDPAARSRLPGRIHSQALVVCHRTAVGTLSNPVSIDVGSRDR
ncbi:MAG: hypothetical protein IPK26_19955 [Planctomycetes bacterium]|nr:hypothetical protein [Planctomycetota bacterium]